MEAVNSLLWFRKCLRLHDNPALEYACKNARHLYPVFVLDSWYLDPDPTAFSPGSARAGINRIQFMLESLEDLDCSLRKRGSRLLLFRGDAADVIIRLLKRWNIGKLCFEYDTEPYALTRDSKVKDFALLAGIEVFSPISHTLFNPEEVIQKNGGKPPLTYQSFLKLVGRPQLSIALAPDQLPSLGDVGECDFPSLPRINELGYGDEIQEEFSPFQGGESEALRRLREVLNDEEWVASFDKPKGDPTAFSKPATTVLSPYLKFGCLSSRYFYQCIQDVYKKVKKHISPPVSLFGQLLWREFFYTVGFGTPNFDRMKGNRICKQIPWNDDDKLFVAWREAKTGYPWIDAVMVQLHKSGWVHHLARHAVACFLTRGDLFIHWEKGRDVFERLLIDSDWSINNGNWLWLSCSSFFYQYHRIYSPTSFGKKYDPDGNFIRHFIPVLKDMPVEYIYEPWTAPMSVQRKASCIIGKDYPQPVIDHVSASNDSKRRLAAAYALNSKTNNLVSEEEIDLLRRKLDQDQNKLSSNKKKKFQ